MGEADLVRKYIEEDPYRPGVADARLTGYGVPVWALVGHLPAVQNLRHKVADDYDLPEEAVQATTVYYDQHRCEIDARIAANTIPAM